jgi:prepilin-type N-terminal cleavage/methylation domain-containing protein
MFKVLARTIHTPNHSWQRGFTLVELIVAVSILLLITGAGIASYINLNDRQTLITTAKDLQSYMRAAQKKARAGDKPSGCDTLNSYGLVSAGASPTIVSLKAICDSGSFTSDTLTFPASVTLQNALDMEFLVLSGGVNNSGTVVLQGKTKTYTFDVNAGGEITEGVLN